MCVEGARVSGLRRQARARATQVRLLPDVHSLACWPFKRQPAARSVRARVNSRQWRAYSRPRPQIARLKIQRGAMPTACRARSGSRKIASPRSRMATRRHRRRNCTRAASAAVTSYRRHRRRHRRPYRRHHHRRCHQELQELETKRPRRCHRAERPPGRRACLEVGVGVWSIFTHCARHLSIFMDFQLMHR